MIKKIDGRICNVDAIVVRLAPCGINGHLAGNFLIDYYVKQDNGTYAHYIEGAGCDETKIFRADDVESIPRKNQHTKEELVHYHKTQSPL